MTGLPRGTLHEFQVQATNAEGTGSWSDSGEHSTRPNTRPTFVNTSGTATVSVPEDTAGGSAIGDPLEATDGDSDTINYSLGGADASLFSVNTSTGQVSTGTGTRFNYGGVPQLLLHHRHRRRRRGRQDQQGRHRQHHRRRRATGGPRGPGDLRSQQHQPGRGVGAPLTTMAQRSTTTT